MSPPLGTVASVSTVAIVPAAGSGTRLGRGPKAFVRVGGEPLLIHAVRGLLRAGCVDHVVVAAPVSAVDPTAQLLHGLAPVTVVGGGATRTASVGLALAAVDGVLPRAAVVLVHDAARAFTPTSVVSAVVDAVRRGAPAVVPVLPVADTVKSVDADGVVTGTPDRTSLRVVQTPQGFAIEVLRRAYADADLLNATDDAGLVERLGVRVATVPGHPLAMKITTPVDLVVIEAMLAEQAGQVIA